MKVLILCGGKGTRLGGGDTPKPLVEIGGKPILWHIMQKYMNHGFDDFILLLGYKQLDFKRWYRDVYLQMGDIVDSAYPLNPLHANVTLIDTGENSGTAERVVKASKYLNDNPFMLTYGDGLSDVDLNKLATCHENNPSLVTVTAVRPPGRFGILEMNREDTVTRFGEKACGTGWINGGFFVMERAFVDTLKGGPAMLEFGPLQECVRNGELSAYRHEGFWQCMDTPRDLDYLQSLWDKGNAPWTI